MVRRLGVLALVFAVALATRLVNLGERSLWLDESTTVRRAAFTLEQILADDPFHPPLYPLLLRAWGSLGPWFLSDAGARLPSAIAGALTVVVGFALLRRLDLPGVWSTTALLGVSGILVWYSQEARSVAITGLLVLVVVATLAVLAAPRVLPKARPPVLPAVEWSVYAVAAIVAAYTHYGALPIVGALNVVYLAAARPTGRALRWWIGANAVVAVAILPLLPALVAAFGFGATTEHVFVLRATALLGGGALVTLIAALVGWRIARRWPSLALNAATLGAIVGLLGVAAFAMTDAGTGIKRHLALVLPIGMIVAGTIVAARTRPWVSWSVVAASVPALLLTLFVHQKEEWRPAADILTRESRPGDVIVLYMGYTAPALARYYHGDVPVTPVAGPDELTGILAAVLPTTRVWLVESNTATNSPTTLAPFLDGRLRRAERFDLYRVEVLRFDP